MQHSWNMSQTATAYVLFVLNQKIRNVFTEVQTETDFCLHVLIAKQLRRTEVWDSLEKSSEDVLAPVLLQV